MSGKQMDVDDGDNSSAMDADKDSGVLEITNGLENLDFVKRTNPHQTKKSKASANDDDSYNVEMSHNPPHDPSNDDDSYNKRSNLPPEVPPNHQFKPKNNH